MTYEEVVGQWKMLADRKSVATMKDEIATFVGDAKKAGATLKQLIASQNRLLLMWYPADWKAAQAEHAHWHNKTFFDNGRRSIEAAFAAAIKEAYAGEISQNKVVKSEALTTKAKEPVTYLKVVGENFKTFTSAEEFDRIKPEDKDK